MSPFERPTTVRVWATIASAAKCRWCRAPIVFRTTDRGRNLPFNARGLVARDIVEDAEGRKFEWLEWRDMHKCPKRPGAAPKPSTSQRRGRRYGPPPAASRPSSRGLF